jgi:ABC-type antimicrobial peptide transport system permease subunit
MMEKRKDKILMFYIRKSMRLALVLSVGAVILVFALSTAGGFSYFSVKKSMSSVVDESPTDLIVVQKDYGPNAQTWGPRIKPRYAGDIINSTAHVNNLIILALKPALGPRPTSLCRIIIGNEVKGSEWICVVGLWSRQTVNFTLSQGSTPPFSLTTSQDMGFRGMLISDDLFQKYNMSLGSRIKVDRWDPATQKPDWEFMDNVVGVTKKTLSQLIEELGIQDVIHFAGYDKAKLVSLNQYPFIIARISSINNALPIESMSSIFFMKFDKKVYMNPWDVDVTVNSLESLGEELVLNVNNASSKIIQSEFNVASEKYWPTITSLEEMREFIRINIVTVFAFGFTMAVVGWYFFGTLSETIIATKAGELQLLHIRGASRKSLSRTMTLLVAIAGIFGAIVGLVFGFLVTTFLTPPILGVSVSSDDLSMTFGGVSLFFYCLFGVMASLLSHRTAFSKMKTTGLQKQEEAKAEKGKSLTGIVILAVALILGTMKATEWILGVKTLTWGQTTNPITSAFLMLIGLIDKTVLDTLGAIFLAYALINLLSLRPKIFSTISYTISSVLSPPLAMLSKKLVHAKSMKMIGSMVITSLLIFNIASANMGHAGITTAWTNLSIAVVGADIRIDMQEEVAPYIFQTLDNTIGVGGYTQILLAQTAIGAPLGGTPVYIVEAAKYTTLVSNLDSSLMSMLKSLNDRGVLVSDVFREIGVLNYGDTVTLEDKELVIMGFLENLPGTLSIPTLEKFAVADAEVIEGINYTVLSRSVLVKTTDRQPEWVVNAMAESMPENMTQLYTVATMSSAMSRFASKMSVSQIVENVMTLLFVASLASFVFAIAAIGVMAYNDAVERRRLDALFRIRGVTRLQLLNMILSEALTFFLFSCIVGLFTGFVMACGYTAYFSATFPIYASPSISYALLIQLLSLFAVYLLVFLIPSISAMRKSAYFHAR